MLTGTEWDSFTVKTLKRWQKICLALSIAVTLLGGGLFLASSRIGVRQNDYKKKQDAPAPMNGDVSLLIYRDGLYVFSEYGCALNAFGTDGSFRYSLSVPVHQNGKARFFMKDGRIFIEDRNGTLYRFDTDGTYLGKIYYNYSETEKDLIYAADAADVLTDTVPAVSKEVPIPYALLYFDDEVIVFSALDAGERNIIAAAQRKSGEITVREYDPAGDEWAAVRALEGSVLVPDLFLTRGPEGHVYRVSFGTLRRDEEILWRTGLPGWALGRPMLGWLIAFLGTAATAVQTKIYGRKKGKPAVRRYAMMHADTEREKS